MANNLRWKAEVDSRQAVKGLRQVEEGVERVESKSKRLKSSSGNASAAIIELGRGASDARFGFVGLANNAERMTELLGNVIKNSGGLRGAFSALSSAILGPAGIVAGISIMIAYGPEIVSFFKRWLFGVKEVDKATKKLNEALTQNAVDSRAKILELKVALDSLFEGDSISDGLDEASGGGVGALELLRKHGIDPTGKSIADLRKEVTELIAKEQALADITAKKAQFAARTNELIEKQKELTKEYTQAEQKLSDQLAKPKYKQNQNYIRNLRKQLEKLKVELRENQAGFIANEEALTKFIESMVKLEQLGGPDTAKLMEFQKSIENLLGGINQAFLESGLTSLGHAIGNALANGTNVAKNAGRALLSILGDIAMQIGKVILTTGLGLEGLKVALSNPFTAGPAAIAAGAALIAAGGALKGIAGGSGARGSSGGSPVTAGSRSAVRADTTSDFGKVQFEISGSNLIGVLQSAGNRRGTNHGSFKLG